ncbi:MAG: tripartite tricarboxylate transporter substrate binding protein [Opitutaceae bacterium]|nr:tripartite tricarboxylate transporter substrate binding protein [Opitutaceae bacterium]
MNNVRQHASWRKGRSWAARRQAALVLLLTFAGLLAACSRRDGSYPSSEIKLIVQASPGGLSDTVSRFMASLLERELGVPVVCVNRPGASGALAFSYVVRRPADGYTIGHAPVEICVVRALGYADVGPDNMELISLVAKSPAVLVVREDAPWNSFAEFVAAAAVKPGGLIMAHSGTGSIWHFNALLMEQATGIRVTYVPYGGSSAALASLLGGHVDCVVAGAGEAIANVQAGVLKPLAVFDEQRSRLYAGVPTSHELGYGFGVPAWSGFFAPKGVPAAMLERLAQGFRAGFATDEWHKLCRERGMESVYMDREEFRAFAVVQAEFFRTEVPKLLTLKR